MPDLSPGAKSLLPWFGTIQAGVNAGLSTHDLFSALGSAIAFSGLPVRGYNAIDVGRLRSIAVAQREASRALSGASADEAITSGMIAGNVVQRGTLVQQTSPKYLARFEHNYLIDGVPATEWRTSIFEGVLPATVGALVDQLARDAERLAAEYNVSNVGIGDISVLAV